MKTTMKNELFICECHNTEHQLIFSYFEDDEDKDVFVSVHLTPDRWYRRIITGIKYIFGYKCCYGHFDEFIFKKEDAERLQGVVDVLRTSKPSEIEMNIMKSPSHKKSL